VDDHHAATPGRRARECKAELMERFRQHAERFGTEMVFDHIHTVELKQHQ